MRGHQLVYDQVHGPFQCSCVDRIDRRLVTVAVLCSQQSCVATDDLPCAGSYVTASLARSHVAPPAVKTGTYVGETSLDGRFCQRVQKGFASWKENFLNVTIHFLTGNGRRLCRLFCGTAWLNGLGCPTIFARDHKV